jgi:hypothetical protein
MRGRSDRTTRSTYNHRALFLERVLTLTRLQCPNSACQQTLDLKCIYIAIRSAGCLLVNPSCVPADATRNLQRSLRVFHRLEQRCGPLLLRMRAEEITPHRQPYLVCCGDLSQALRGMHMTTTQTTSSLKPRPRFTPSSELGSFPRSYTQSSLIHILLGAILQKAKR